MRKWAIAKPRLGRYTRFGMDLSFQATLNAPLRLVEACLLAPSMVAHLGESSTVLASAELRTRLEEGTLVRREAFYVLAEDVFAGLSQRIVPKIAWTERVVWDRSAHAGTFVILPEVPKPLLHRVRCEGSYHLQEVLPDQTIRLITGILSIDAPFVGARAERLMGELLERFFKEEAALLERLAIGP